MFASSGPEERPWLGYQGGCREEGPRGAWEDGEKLVAEREGRTRGEGTAWLYPGRGSRGKDAQEDILVAGPSRQ